MKTVLLGDICDFQNGFAFSSKHFSTSDGLPLIRIRDIKNGLGTETKYTGTYDDSFLVNKGDYLIGMDGEFRCYEWNGPDALLNQRVCRLRGSNDVIDPRFMFYGINEYLKDIEDHTGFTTVKHISIKQIRNIRFPLPSIDEQKRIVKKLDEVFSVIDKAKDNTLKKLSDLEELRKSILKKAFDGEL